MCKLRVNCQSNLRKWGRILRWGVAAIFLTLASASGWAQPTNDLFTNAISLVGIVGTTGGSNVGATAEPGEPDHAGNPGGPYASVWYLWTAPSDGFVEFDTEGSAFDTELAVYTSAPGTNGPSVTNLTLVAQNDDVNYPIDLTSKASFSVSAGATYYIAVDGYQGSEGAITLNWSVLSGALSAGQFQFASGMAVSGFNLMGGFGGFGGFGLDMGVGSSPGSPGTNGNAPLYVFGEMESIDVPAGANGFMAFSPPRLTVMRVGGYSGRVQVNYTITNSLYTNFFSTNIFGSNIFDTNFVVSGTITQVFFTNMFFTNYAVSGMLQMMDRSGTYIYQNTNYDLFVSGTNQDNGQNSISTTNLGTNFTVTCDNSSMPSTNGGGTNSVLITQNFCTNVMATNLVPAAVYGQDYIVVGNNTLDFLDYQMSADITNLVILGNNSFALGLYNRVLVATIDSAQFDPQETTNLAAPSISTSLGTAYINVLDSMVIGPNAPPVPYTPFVVTNTIFNFEKAVLRDWEGNGPFTDGITNRQKTARVFVNRTGTNFMSSASVDYIIDYDFPLLTANADNFFFLQPGSDYGTPPGSVPPSSQPLDYVPVTGTLNWGADDGVPKSFDIIITNDGLVEFNEDILLQLQNPGGGVLGQLCTANLTIVFNDQPAGAADRFHNESNWHLSVPPFNSAPGANGPVYAVAVQRDDRTLLAGSFSAVNTTPRSGIARMNFDGSLDTTFLGNANSGANGVITCMALQTNGSVIIGGNFTSFNGTNRYGIARLNSDGSLDTTFDTGLGFNGDVRSLLLQPDGRVLVAGDFITVNRTNRNYIARLNPDGSLDTSFDPGIGPSGPIDAMGLLPGGKVVIGGEFTNVDLVSLNRIARLNPDGTLDPLSSFNPGTGADDTIRAITIEADGKILVGGAFKTFNLITNNCLARLNPDGSLDFGFNTGSGADDTVYTIVQQPDGNILLGGLFRSINGTRRVGIARLLLSGIVDTTFMDTAYNQFAGLINNYYNSPKSWLYSMALQSDGNIIIGGSFSQVGGDGNSPAIGGTYTGIYAVGGARDSIAPRANIARLIGGSTAGPGNVSFVNSSYSADIAGGPVYVTLLRTNGFLGPATVAFGTSDIPGGATNGVDYDFSAGIYGTPTWLSSYPSGGTWMSSDGLIGQNNDTLDFTGANEQNKQSDVFLQINDVNPARGDRALDMQLSLPAGGVNISLGGENIPLGLALGLAEAPMTIVDNYEPHGTFSFSSPIYTVNENATNAVITVLRTGGSVGQVSLQYATIKGGTAVPGATNDYILTAGQLTFASGVTNATFLVPIVNNSALHPDRTVFLQLFNVSAGGAIGVSNAVLTIINDNFLPGRVSFASSNFNAHEVSGAATITVVRTGGSSGVLSVYAATSNGTATNGADYVGVTNLLTWNSGDASVKSFSVPLIHNGLVTSNEVVNLRLFSPVVDGSTNNNALGLQSTATLTILNDDFYGNLSFSTPTYSVNDNAGVATITILRLGGGAQSISVQYATSDGNAVAFSNYTPVSGTLTFGPGEFAKSFTVPIKDGGVQDINRFFAVALTNAFVASGPGVGGGLTLGYPSSAIVTIINSETYNDPPGGVDPIFDSYAAFNAPVYSLVLQSNGALVAGGDFTMADGVPRNRVARLNSDGTLDVKFSSPTGGANGSVRSVVGQTDGKLLIGGLFSLAAGVNRNDIARLTFDGALDDSFNPGSGADQPVNTIAETFDTNGLRQVLIGGSFTVINGVAAGNLARLNDDGSVDTGFNANAVNGTVYAISIYSTNDVINGGKILIGGDFTSVNGAVVSHIARLNADGSLDTTFNPGAGPDDSVRAIAIQVDGNVLIGGLFASVAGNGLNHIARLTSSGSVDAAFTPGVGANDAVTCIAIQEDQKIVLGGDFTQASGVTRNRLTRLNSDGTVDPGINFGLGANDFVAALAIQPDDSVIIAGGFTQFNNLKAPYIARLFGRSETGSGALEFTTANFQADIGGSNAVVTVRRDGGTGDPAVGNVYVDFNTSDGTAVAGVDYLGVTNVLTFPVGETFRSINIPIIDTVGIVIGADKTVNLTLSNPTNATLGLQPTALLTITNQSSQVNFSSEIYSVSKNNPSGTALITVVRSGSSSGAASVQFETTTNGTALPGVDYVPTTNLVSFADGQSNQTVTISLINNGLIEGDRTVSMALLSPSNTVLNPTVPPTATLTIVDANLAPGNLMFAATNYSVLETATNAIITLARTNGSLGEVSVTYFTGGGNAIPGLDYPATTNSVTFLDGETSKSFTVQVFDNTNLIGNVSLGLTLTNPTGGAQIIGPVTVPLTIIDANTGFSFAQPGYFAIETGGNVTVGVDRVGGTNGSASVQYSTSDGTALAGTNYRTAGGTLTFAPGEMFKTFTIPVLYDPQITGNLIFFVALSNPSSGKVVPPTTTAVTVIDVDTGFSFALPTNSVSKSGTNAIIGVLREGSTGTSNSVHFSTSDGTAVAGVKYIATNGVLTFLPGQTSNFFLVPIIKDNQADGDQTVNILLSSPTGGARLVAPTTEVLTIIDTEAGFSFSSPTYTIAENGVVATIPVLLSGVTTNDRVTVNFATSDGSATNGIHYQGTNGTMIFTNGQLSQTFTIPIIDANLIGGGETVNLILSNPSTNAALVQPSQATLTIFNNDGSLIVQAGSALISEGFSPPNNAVDPGETVTVLLALRNSSGANTTNLTATLLPGNGVTSPSPAGPVSYGALVTNGPSASQPFSFTAQGTNGSLINAVLQLQDGAKNLGSVSFGFTLGTTTHSFTNGALITINDNAPATPYPSTLVATNLSGTVSKLTVTVTNLAHGNLSDVAILLKGPSGQEDLLMGHVGGPHTVTNLNLTFDDSAPPFTANAPVSGTYSPTQIAFPGEPLFPIDFPATTNGAAGGFLPGTYGTRLADFIGSNPDGTWLLYVLDDAPLDGGIISNGWILNVSTLSVVTPTVDLVVGLTAAPNPTIVTSNITYTISVTNAGPSTATGIVATNLLPAGLTFVSAGASQGTTSNNAGTVYFNLGTLAKDGVATATVTAATSQVGPVTNTVAAFANEVEANPGNNGATLISTVASESADLAIGMADSPDPLFIGNNLTYTITVTNLGPATAGDVIVTDTLPGGVSLVSVNPAAGSNLVGGVVTVSLGDLGSGATATVTLVVHPAAGGTITNGAAVSSSVLDPFKGNNSAAVKTAVQAPQITVGSSSGGLTFSWSAIFTNYVLESSPSLNPATWTPVGGAVQMVNGQNVVTVPVATGNQFFRLSAPAP